MDIEITNPINLTLDVVELDEHIPSMKFNLTVQVKKFGYSSMINAQLWIECRYINDFINKLQDGNTALINDMNSCFELFLNPSQNLLEWSCAKEDLEGNVTVSKGREKLTDESLNAIYTAFNDYPKWW
ncbi:hypothetical protein MXM51_21645 [Pantoea stewartii]|uniref:hypothetical protein n=1 Tax=Pantoea stewartii TaxID=66269 RepID=UPI002DB5AAD0|nr:hypothetical protein [Pantoea stewartii]MEB6537115.1 hypothetical protein [Pantoea stewartii]